MRTFAIGDVHGHAGKLEALLERLRPRAAEGDSLVFMGDYIDRGPDSRGVIERILTEEKAWPGPVVALIGNHEAVLLSALFGKWASAWAEWLFAFDGAPTLRSYGSGREREDLRAALPESHRRFLEGLKRWHEDENGIYVHAGIPRGRRPEACLSRELLWHSHTEYDWEKPVVFGHANLWKGRPVSLPGAIGLDTGCGSGGPLTGVMLPEREFVSV